MGTITEKLSHLLETKNLIKDAIEAKGIDVPGDATFRTYAEYIRAIIPDSSTGISDNLTEIIFESEFIESDNFNEDNSVIFDFQELIYAETYSLEEGE